MGGFGLKHCHSPEIVRGNLARERNSPKHQPTEALDGAVLLLGVVLFVYTSWSAAKQLGTQTQHSRRSPQLLSVKQAVLQFPSYLARRKFISRPGD